jgi:predicted metal-dependent hydrolase
MTATQTPTAPTSPASATGARSIPTRRISFDESLADLDKHFACDGDLIMSHVVATLSSVFPDGEDYFVRSVRHYRDQITDPELRRQVSGFIGQEAVHGREHRALNDRLDQLGYPTKRMERFTRWGLAQRERIMSPASNLAATAALEHFTATLAEVVLTDPDARALFGSEAITNVLLWHALEESEHKAVAFDVYRAVGASERTRTITMDMICVGFIGGMTLQAIISMLGDRDTYRPRTLLRSLRRLRTSPFLTKDVWKRLRDYNRPDFHPDDHETDDLVEQWRSTLFGEDGTLVDLLAAKPAAAA